MTLQTLHEYLRASVYQDSTTVFHPADLPACLELDFTKTITLEYLAQQVTVIDNPGDICTKQYFSKKISCGCSTAEAYSAQSVWFSDKHRTVPIPWA